MLPYIIPFAIYVGLSLAGTLFQNGNYYIYPVKTIAVALSLIYFRKSYPELLQRITLNSILIAVVVGTFAFFVWIFPEGWYKTLGESEFNPLIFENHSFRMFLIISRITGAVLVVPVFEELFWRSFLIRWIDNQDFQKVPIGQFSVLPFILVAIFFGIEHHRWLVGIVTGFIYNGVLIHQKNIWPCIVAHAVTNLALATYVLMTGHWSFW